MTSNNSKTSEENSGKVVFLMTSLHMDILYDFSDRKKLDKLKMLLPEVREAIRNGNIRICALDDDLTVKRHV